MTPHGLQDAITECDTDALDPLKAQTSTGFALGLLEQLFAPSEGAADRQYQRHNSLLEQPKGYFDP